MTGGDPSAGAFDGREHVLPVRVYYEDTDLTGVVYHANYVRYFERGRSDFLRLAGVDHKSLLDRPDPASSHTRHSLSSPPAGNRRGHRAARPPPAWAPRRARHGL